MKYMKEDWIAFEKLIRPQKETAIGYIKDLLCFCILPAMTISVLLFYVFDNPGPSENSSSTKATASWWIIFLGVRHPIVLAVARFSEFIFSNFCGASSPRFMKLVGPRVGLLLAHSKGWPCVLLFYSLYCLQLLYGNYSFVKHWLYWYVRPFFLPISLSNGETISKDKYIDIPKMMIHTNCDIGWKF